MQENSLTLETTNLRYSAVMLSPALEGELSRYEIGATLRRLRLAKKMGLVELGRHTGLSAAMLSKIERSRLYPTLPTLLRVAMVFGVGLEYFFSEDKRRPAVTVVRKADRLTLPERPGDASSAYAFQCLDFRATERELNAYYATFEPIAASDVRTHQHRGVEFIYVMDGTLVLHSVGGEQVLEAGDAVYFEADFEHGYRSAGGARATAIVVTVP